MHELLLEPVGVLAQLVRRGEVRPRELVEASLGRIEALEPALNAFVEVDAEGALAAADASEPGDARPFAGIPVAVKANIPVRGRLMTLGSAMLAGTAPGMTPSRRAVARGRARRGRDDQPPEFGILPTTEPRHGGATRNPWDTGRTPGGSSGGSAAAVAAGMVAVAHANDGGGSTRIPAACCGLVGLKPSRGRISRGPDSGDSFLVADGVLTRTVLDTAMLLDVLAGYEAGDATWAPPPSEPFTRAAVRDPGKLRIAVSLRTAYGGELDPECERGVRVAIELLEGLGHEVVEGDPPLPGPELLRRFAGLFGPAVSTGMAFAERIAGRAAGEDDIEPLSRALRARSESVSAVDYLLVQAQMQRMARRIIGFFADHDVLLTPALAERPLPIGECTGVGADPMADFARSAHFTPYTALYNVTGQPAITLPVALGDDGLPTSVQLVGRPLGEETLLGLATGLEHAAAVWSHRPPVAANA
jgi:amidase